MLQLGIFPFITIEQAAFHKHLIAWLENGTFPFKRLEQAAVTNTLCQGPKYGIFPFITLELIPDSYPYSPGGLVTILEHVVTHSRMLDPIQLVNDDIIDSIFRQVTSCGVSPVSEDLDQSENG